jgi:hypothetical protein
VTSAALANCATENAAIASNAPKPVLIFIVIAIPRVFDGSTHHAPAILLART